MTLELNLRTEHHRALSQAHLIEDLTLYYEKRFMAHDRSGASLMRGWAQSAVSWLAARCETAPHRVGRLIRLTKTGRRRLRWLRGEFEQERKRQRRHFYLCDQIERLYFPKWEGWTFDEVLDWMENQSREDEEECRTDIYAQWARWGEQTSPFEAMAILNALFAMIDLAIEILDNQTDPRAWEV